MTAVTIDASIVDGSSTKVTANPAYPIQNPLDIAELATGIISAPVNITELAHGYIIAPINIAELAAGAVVAPIDIAEVAPANIATPVNIAEQAAVNLTSPVNIAEVAAGAVLAPVNITELAASSLSVPASITANALDPETPPFSLKNARILYDNKLLGSTVTASSGTNAGLVLVPNTADRWAFTGTGTSNIQFLLSVNANIDTVCIGAHNLGSSGATVQAFYDIDASGVFTAFAASQTPSEDTAIMFHIGTSLSVRRIQINITVATSSIFIGSVYAGIALQMQRPFFAGHSPLPLSAKTVRYGSVTEGGNFVGEQIRRLGFRSSAPFKNLSNDWYRLYFQPFVVHARTLPYFFAWNLEQYATDVGYCKTNEDITPAYGSLDMLNVSFDMVGFG